MGNCKGKLSKSEKNKCREDEYVKNNDRNKIDHGSDGPTVHKKTDENEERSVHAKISTKPVNAIDHGKDGPAAHKKTDVDENEESSIHTNISTKPVIAIDHGKDGQTVHKKTDVDENEESSVHAKIATKPFNAIDLGTDGPTVHKKADTDENEESSTHAKISTKPVNAIDHGKDGPTVHKKTDIDEHEDKNKMSTESNIIEHANEGPTINQLPIVSNNSDPSTSALESKNRHENNVPEIKDTNFKTENSGDSLICTEENSRPCKKDTNVTANETHVIIEPTNGMNRAQKDTMKKNQDPITQVQTEAKKKNQDPITQVQTEAKKKNQDPIMQQTERHMYNFACGYQEESEIAAENGNKNRTNDNEPSVVTPDLNVNTGDIHCTDIDLNLNFGDKHGTDSSQNAGDKHGTDLSQNAGDKHGTDLSQNTGDTHGTDLSQNTGDKHGTDLSQNAGDKHGTDLSQNAGEKHGTAANKIDTMPEVPDMNTSNKTSKGGEVTQDKDQNNPADKTDGDDNKDMTGYDSAKYAKRIDDKDKKSEIKSTKKGKKKKKIKNRTDFNLGDINTSVMNIACELGNVITTIRNPPETRKTEVVNISCTTGDIKTEIIHEPPASSEEATPQVDMKIMKVLTEVKNSIGMFQGKVQGSCWRAGTDLIVTAWHLVDYHISEYGEPKPKNLSSVKIKFDYTGSGDCDECNIFEVEPKVLYHNETLDTAILRLKPNGKVTFPPPFRRLDHFLKPADDEDLTIYLIGHPNGSPQRVNLDVGLWNPTEERMQLLETFCTDKGYENGYTELDKTERLVVKCEFGHGASGCPGVVVLDDNQLYLVTMFLKGFPNFYCRKQFKGEEKKNFPKSKLFQQGVNIGAIYEDLKKNPMYADIFEDIFIKQNPPVNTGPSGIIPSENYTDGYQDCHGGVSTSTQPTSDEGTHHVTSPCQEETSDEGTRHVTSPCQEETSDERTHHVTSPRQEETNENATMEKQGSQMVISGQ